MYPSVDRNPILEYYTLILFWFLGSYYHNLYLKGLYFLSELLASPSYIRKSRQGSGTGVAHEDDLKHST